MPKTPDWKKKMEASRQRNRELEVRYCSSVPRKPLPNGRVLVHNHIAHTKDMPAGLQGFRCLNSDGRVGVVCRRSPAVPSCCR